ncbi:MBL fold metallo-hydrolase [Baekduia soli]|uniref:MBL fold metallo-hydrolase n=1 Tax=Baekduia soli TaxID=496014 RepID=A0A5B8U008_9ACTN|nr:MBL fold metallo-hydrolase [Baekduia soli]QEC46304.1 MBL fold metallo-hydrolase [Baekduia soli]
MPAAATILGSGGFIPTGARETSSLLLLDAAGDGAVVVDAGTGLRRLITDRALLRGRTRLDVLLTHFHIDHICGLAYLTELRGVEVCVHGPGAALYGTPTADVLHRLFSVPIMPIDFGVIGVGVAEIAPGGARFGGLEVAVRRQDLHTNPTLGFRFGDDLVWCTDTEEDPGTVAFARGARVLAHDAWGPPAAPGHAEPAGAARLATQAGVPRLVLIHVPPNADEADLHARAAAEHEHVTVATDGLALLDL